jgi:hypothetical protein
MSETPERVIAPGFGLTWGPAIAGAIGAAALAFVLDSFGELPEFQDGMHGLLVWGFATLLAGLIAAVTVPLLPRTLGMDAAGHRTWRRPHRLRT